MAKLAVIIPAAGSGTRMGSRLPKPFLLIGNQPILKYTIASFLKPETVKQVVVATSTEWFGEVKTIFESLGDCDAELELVEGGNERQFSIQNALSVIRDDVELIAVHDAVRPFIKKELIEKCALEAQKYGGAMIAVPAKDTIKQADSDLIITNTPDRNKLWQAQTPQIFKRRLLMKAYAVAQKENFLGTDDASLVERIGGQVKLVEGDRENLKITYPIDLKIAELILSEAMES